MVKKFVCMCVCLMMALGASAQRKVMFDPHRNIGIVCTDAIPENAAP